MSVTKGHRLGENLSQFDNFACPDKARGTKNRARAHMVPCAPFITLAPSTWAPFLKRRWRPGLSAGAGDGHETHGCGE